MQEAEILSYVTAVVVAGLAVWVVATWARRKEPWTRGPLAPSASAPATVSPAPEASQPE